MSALYPTLRHEKTKEMYQFRSEEEGETDFSYSSRSLSREESLIFKGFPPSNKGSDWRFSWETKVLYED